MFLPVGLPRVQSSGDWQVSIGLFQGVIFHFYSTLAGLGRVLMWHTLHTKAQMHVYVPLYSIFTLKPFLLSSKGSAKAPCSPKSLKGNTVSTQRTVSTVEVRLPSTIWTLVHCTSNICSLVVIWLFWLSQHRARIFCSAILLDRHTKLQPPCVCVWVNSWSF